jgi:GAF domain-containing protein
MKFFDEFIPLLGFCLNIVLAIFVLRENFRHRLNQIFTLFLAGMAFWALSFFAINYSPFLRSVLPWDKLTLIFISIVCVSFYHFAILSTGIQRATRLIPWVYIGVLIVVALSPTDLITKGLKETWYGFSLEPGLLFLPFLIIFYGLVGCVVITLVRISRNSKSVLEKKRHAHIIVGAIIFILGFMFNLLVISGRQWYPVGMLFNIIFSLICAYALLRYQFLDIWGFIRKGTAYVLVSAIATAFYFAILFVVYDFISGVWGLDIWLNIAFIFILALGLQPALNWSRNTVDRLFYRGRYDYLNALERLAEETTSITNLDFIAESLVSTITNALRCSKIWVLLPDIDGKNFVSFRRLEDKKAEIFSLRKDSALVWCLGQRKRFLNRQDLEILPDLAALTEKERQRFDELETELFIPLLTVEGLRGILILGRKLSEEDYSIEEIKLLHIVANQMASVIENARLYDLQTRRYLEQALVARISRTISSELDFGRVYYSLVSEIKEIMPVDYSTLLLLDESGKKLLNCLEFNQLAVPSLESVPERFIAGDISQASEYIYEPDIVPDKSSPLRLLLFKAGLRSFFSIPLCSEGKEIGYLILASQGVDAYNEDHVRLLKQVAVQMVIAYEKSRLYELEKKARLELEKQDKERTEFINSLIHEIKTPITAILASSDLLSEELSGTPGILGFD